MIEMSVEIKSGLSVILYELFYMNEADLKNLSPFGEKQRKYYEKFDENKIEMIGKALEWAERNSDYPFNTIYPRHSKIENKLVFNFLKYTLRGLVDSGLYKV
jgi:hypothetical protein